jgi:hypothetical protein
MQSTELGEIKEINSAKWNVLYFIQNLPSIQNCMITLYCCKVNKIRKEIWHNSSKTALHNLMLLAALYLVQALRHKTGGLGFDYR